MRKALLTGGGLMALVMAATPAFAAGAANNSADDAPASAPGDIVVTATKRATSINQIGAPISAVSGDELARMNANSLSDYITRMPGVVFNDYQPGVSEVVIRGIAATTYHEQGQTTVGYYLNEISVVEPGFPIGIPDIDTFDLDRVEVLRGPQGTLFGSSTLGGLVNYVAKTADTHKLDAAAETLIGSTAHSNGQANYAGKVMVNIPIVTDKLAVRLMALQRFDAGYIDNIGVSPTIKGANDFRTRGLRGSIVWTPTDHTKLTYLISAQDTRLDDGTYITTAQTYDRVTARTEPQTTGMLLNSLRLDQDLGKAATLTVIGSTDRKDNTTTFSDPYGYVTGITTGPNAAYDTAVANANIKTIEARVASKDNGSAWRWLIGTSYMHATKYSYDQMWAPGAEAIAGSVLAPNDRIYGYKSVTLNEDLGIFGEVTWKPVPMLEVTGGGRWFHTRAAGDVLNQAGFVSGLTTDASGHVDQRENGFTPKANVTLHADKNTLFYATWSRGYRVGGINPNAGLLPAIPAAYGSDRVTNYEVGAKSQLFDKRLSLDLTLFDMEWSNIQAREFGPAPSYYSYVINAAKARVRGVEFSGAATLAKGLSATTSITYQDAHLASFLPYEYAVGGGYASGSTLPGSSKWSISNNLRYEADDLPGKPALELAHRYLSKAPVAFGSDSTRGGFNIVDTRLSAQLPHHLRAMVFISNLFNTYGILSGPFTAQTAPAYSIVRPRTFGLRLDWSL